MAGGTTAPSTSTTGTVVTPQAGAGLSGAQTVPSANFLQSNINDPLYHKNKILAQIEAQSEITAVKSLVAAEFKKRNPQSWYNWAFLKYRDAGMSEKLFFNDVMNIINDDKCMEGERIAYEQESKDEFLAKILELYRFRRSETMVSLLDGSALRNLRPVESMQRILTELPQNDTSLLEDTFVAALPNEIKMYAKGDIKTLRRNMAGNSNEAIMNEWAKNIQSIMPKITADSPPNANMIAKNDGNADNRVMWEMQKQIMIMQKQLTEMSMNKDKINDGCISQAEDIASKNKTRQIVRDDQAQNNMDKTRPFKNVHFEGNNNQTNGKRYIPSPPDFVNRQNGNANSGGYRYNQWRNPQFNNRGGYQQYGNTSNNGGYQQYGNTRNNGGYQQYENPHNNGYSRYGGRYNGGDQYPKSRDLFENLCRAHQRNGDGDNGQCETGCRYNPAGICYAHNRHGNSARNVSCGRWCRMNQSKNAYQASHDRYQ